jgi:hypothetical protein
MAKDEAASQALVDAIEALAKTVAEDAGGASSALKHAAAANQLAEAYAWLAAPAQPHGGGADVSD